MRYTAKGTQKALQDMADWIGDHWVRKDWGIESEKLHEAMDLLDAIAKCCGFDVSKGNRVRRGRSA